MLEREVGRRRRDLDGVIVIVHYYCYFYSILMCVSIMMDDHMFEAANSRQRIQWAVPAADGWETCRVDAADLELGALPLGVHPHAELLGPVLPLCALVGRVRKLARQQREGLAGVGAVDCDELLPRSVGLLLGFRLRRVRCSFFV